MLDRHDHAVDDHHDHPPGVLKTRCGHYLLAVATRLDEPSLPLRCPDCQEIFTTGMASLARVSGIIRSWLPLLLVRDDVDVRWVYDLSAGCGVSSGGGR
ncbi:MAG: hypothetical protein M3Y48_19410, partial [Actinomycetota bacterium]|nr:hypothetical protein [Actinomycetota bacterium]